MKIKVIKGHSVMGHQVEGTMHVEQTFEERFYAMPLEKNIPLPLTKTGLLDHANDLKKLFVSIIGRLVNAELAYEKIHKIIELDTFVEEGARDKKYFAYKADVRGATPFDTYEEVFWLCSILMPNKQHKNEYDIVIEKIVKDEKKFNEFMGELKAK